MGRHRRASRPSSPLLLLLLLASNVWAQSSSNSNLMNFGFYPDASQNCLYQSSEDTSCATEDTVQALNKCLCSNTGDFVTNSATCLAINDPSDLADVWSTMSSACTDSDTPLEVSEPQFMSAASAATASTSSSQTATSSLSSVSSTSNSAPTQSATSIVTSTTTTAGGGVPTTTSAGGADGNSSSNNGGSSSGLSSGAKTGTIAGSTVAGVAILGAVAYALIRYRRRRIAEETHPMLPYQQTSPKFGGDPAHPDSLRPGNPFHSFDAAPAFDSRNEQRETWLGANSGGDGNKWRGSNESEQHGLSWGSSYTPASQYADERYTGSLQSPPAPPSHGSAMSQLEGSQEPPIMMMGGSASDVTLMSHIPPLYELAGSDQQYPAELAGSGQAAEMASASMQPPGARQQHGVGGEWGSTGAPTTGMAPPQHHHK